MSLAAKLRRAPGRVVTGAFILNSGIGKLKGDESTAVAAHGMAAGAYPFLGKVPPKAFLRGTAVAETALGAALLLPIVPAKVAGAGLTGFSVSLLGMWWRTPGMHEGVRPTQQGITIAKDVWMLGIGTSLLVDGVLGDAGDSRSVRKANRTARRAERKAQQNDYKAAAQARRRELRADAKASAKEHAKELRAAAKSAAHEQAKAARKAAKNVADVARPAAESALAATRDAAETAAASTRSVAESALAATRDAAETAAAASRSAAESAAATTRSAAESAVAATRSAAESAADSATTSFHTLADRVNS
jgi:uncharacterized membrane protein YphA (DoxX/SURF4 family)